MRWVLLWQMVDGGRLFQVPPPFPYFLSPCSLSPLWTCRSQGSPCPRPNSQQEVLVCEVESGSPWPKRHLSGSCRMLCLIRGREGEREEAVISLKLLTTSEPEGRLLREAEAQRHCREILLCLRSCFLLWVLWKVGPLPRHPVL